MMKTFRNKVMGKKPRDSVIIDSPVLETASSTGPDRDGASDDASATPEATASRLVRSFCLPNGDTDGNGPDVALLPSIVEAAESSPQAASECARSIRKLMYKGNWTQPDTVYNAIMLIRILVENPGFTFTRNIDKKFVETVRDVLRNCQNAHVVQFLIEALKDFESKPAADEGLGRLIEMWQKEKAKSEKAYKGRSSRRQQPQPMPPSAQPPMQPYGSYQPQPMPPTHFDGRSGGPSGRTSGSLPRPLELKKRIEEARTTASVLADVVNTNSPESLLAHDLTSDLSSRCRRAVGQILEYLNKTDPTPDNSEMAALLSVHEAVQQSLHHYHRAVLEARKQMGIGESRRSENGDEPIEMSGARKGKSAAPNSPGAGGASRSNGRGRGGAPDYEHRGYNSGEYHRSSGTNGNRATDSGDDETPVMTSSSFAYHRDNSLDEDLYGDDEDMAAAIAASRAPSAHARPSHRYPRDVEDPFLDVGPAESSRSSSHARPSYGGGSRSGGYGTSAAGAGAYTRDDDSDRDVDTKGKGKGSKSENPSRYSGYERTHSVSPIETDDDYNYRTPRAGGAGAGGSSSAGNYAGGPVYRY